METIFAFSFCQHLPKSSLHTGLEPCFLISLDLLSLVTNGAYTCAIIGLFIL